MTAKAMGGTYGEGVVRLSARVEDQRGQLHPLFTHGSCSRRPQGRAQVLVYPTRSLLALVATSSKRHAMKLATDEDRAEGWVHCIEDPADVPGEGRRHVSCLPQLQSLNPRDGLKTQTGKFQDDRNRNDQQAFPEELWILSRIEEHDAKDHRRVCQDGHHCDKPQQKNKA